MARERNKQVCLMWILVAGFLCQNLVIAVTSTGLGEQKNYYPSPDPHAGTPPSGSHGTPPSHGSGGTPPSHGTPSHGGGYHHTPSTPSGGNCGTPPHEPSTPSTPPRTPSHGSPPSHGGGSPPTYGGGSPPTYGGGSPPTPVIVSPPRTPSHGSPPSHGGGSPPTYGGGSPPTYGGGSPPTPVIVSPPTPIDPGTPSIPTPPFIPAPTPPIGGTCDFWRNHPTLIWGLLGWWGTLGNAFGGTSVPGFGATMSLPQALSNTRTDGFGALYREGTASYLNSMVNHRFPFSTKQVRESFVSALGSNKAAAAQARLFKLANEGHLKPRT